MLTTDVQTYIQINDNLENTIVIKPDPGVDPAKEPGPGLHELTWVTRVNSNELGKNKKKYLKF